MSQSFQCIIQTARTFKEHEKRADSEAQIDAQIAKEYIREFCINEPDTVLCKIDKTTHVHR